jgi:NAD(P)-dependent dehydrogenase (short-subunit alcohol dehydrogenase family)
VTVAADRKAVVTGGASGFGFAVARRLVAANVGVAVVDVSQERLEKAARELGDDVVAVRADVRDATGLREAVNDIASRLGGLDTLVVSAGVIHIKPLEDVTEDDWDAVLDINLKGAFLTVQAAAPHLRASGRGRVVGISSDAGRRGFAWIQAYTASKFGLIGLLESFAVELAPEGVTVNCVCPVGCPTTAMGRDVLDWKVRRTGVAAEEVVAATASFNPLGRNASESDVAEAIMFFLSEEAGFLTGCTLDVDGGAHLGFLPGA